MGLQLMMSKKAIKKCFAITVLSLLILCTEGERNNPSDPGGSNYQAPRINYIQPLDTTVIEGNSVKFKVSASNADYYQWKRGYENVGVNSNYYSFTASSSHNNKSIWCIVSNEYGSDTSNLAYLTVLPNHDITVFYDGFSNDNNPNGWWISNLQSYIKTWISDGYYYIDYDNLGRTIGLLLHVSDLNLNGDFTVEISAEYMSGLTDSKFGLIFYASSDQQDYYRFGIENEKKYEIYKRYDGEWKALVNPKYNSAINSYLTNILKIIKVGNNTYFYINDILVAEEYISSIYGNRFGFFVSEQIQVRFDYIKITR